MKKRIAKKIVNGWSKPRYKKINPSSSLSLPKIHCQCCVPIYRKWTMKQLECAKRRIGIKDRPVLPLKMKSMWPEIDMKLKIINI